MSKPVVNLAALEPLFAPHEEPNQHRARAQGGQPAQAKKGRRPSRIIIAQPLRSHVKAWRKLSREIDSDQNPYACIVSVLMLREGWDVRNVTTIVPLRRYTSKADILPEQTLGRGLRRMTPPGEAAELVTTVARKFPIRRKHKKSFLRRTSARCRRGNWRTTLGVAEI